MNAGRLTGVFGWLPSSARLGAWVEANIEITVQVFNPHARTGVNVGSNFFRVVRWA